MHPKRLQCPTSLLSYATCTRNSFLEGKSDLSVKLPAYLCLVQRWVHDVYSAKSTTALYFRVSQFPPNQWVLGALSLGVKRPAR